ncbi:hypothetical protein L914_11668 [Phytophthora nicotianae]|uniref:Uncharacterized protein n=1 Tax=Phytophthora nicotianae TaxID=4792 RepID=W2N4U1_PHYNI|nr:hypothetical protein L914_11668 [Phytophthora nicotianae]
MSIHSDDCVILTDDDVITDAPSSTMSLRAGSGHFPSISFLIRESQLALHHSHTKNAVDRGFGLMREKFAKEEVWTADQLLEIINDSSSSSALVHIPKANTTM